MAYRKTLPHDTNYTTRKGSSTAGDIGWEMFPEKTEFTPMIENTDQLVYDDRRRGLRDMSTNLGSLFAYDEPMRNTAAVDRLNLRDGGARVTTEAWKNTDYDTQFHDKDPRGYLTDQNWKEMRRQGEARAVKKDFRNDGGYSITSGNEHPNTKYGRMRDTQKLAQMRMNIFDTSYESFANNNATIFSNESSVYKSQTEPNPGLQTREWAPAQHINLSNIVTMGGKFRDQTTTDHKVMEGSYGKLYKNAGLLGSDTALRILDGESPWPRVDGKPNAPRTMKGYMAAQIYQDSTSITPKTSSAIARILMHNEQSGKYMDSQSFNPRRTAEVVGLVNMMGITDPEIKFLESMTQSGNKQASRKLAEVHDLIDKVRRMTPHERLAMQERIARSTPGLADPSQTRLDSLHNIKQREFGSQYRSNPGAMPDPGAVYNPDGTQRFQESVQTRAGQSPIPGDGIVWDRDVSQTTQLNRAMPGGMQSSAYGGFIPGNTTDANYESQSDIVYPADMRENFYTTATHQQWDNFMSKLDTEFGEPIRRDISIGPMGDKYARHGMVDTIEWNS